LETFIDKLTSPERGMMMIIIIDISIKTTIPTFSAAVRADHIKPNIH
jgi:hypothetical protein